MRIKPHSSLCALLALVLMAACAPVADHTQEEQDIVEEPTVEDHASLPDEEIIAEWTGGRIYISYLDDIVQPERTLASVRLQEGVDEMRYIASKRREVLQTLLNNYLLIAEAEARNLTISEAEREELRRQARSQFDTEEEYLKNLEASGQTEEELIDFLATIALGRKCLEQQQMNIWESITLEAKNAYYFDNIDLFTPPARYMVNWVVIYTTDERSEEEARARAEELRTEVSDLIADVTEFNAKRTVMQDYAKEYSEHYSGDYSYGYTIINHKPSDPGDYSPEFIDALDETDVGELSEVVPIKDGFAFFLTREKTDSFVQPFESDVVQMQIPRMILQEKMDEWHESLREKHNLVIYEERFHTVPYQTTADDTAPLSADPGAPAFTSTQQD